MLRRRKGAAPSALTSAGSLWRALVIVLGLGLTLGCGHRPPLLPIALGPYDVVPPAPVWDATVTAITRAGYQPSSMDSARGLIEVPARVRVRGEGQPRLEIQFYAEGWIACTARLPEGARERERVRAALEAEELAVAIVEHLEAAGLPARATP